MSTPFNTTGNPVGLSPSNPNAHLAQIAGNPGGHSLQWYAAAFDKQKAGSGAAFLAFARQHPNWGPYYAARIYALTKGTGGFAKALGAGANGLGKFTQAALNSTSALDPFHGLNLGNWVLRIGEIILGVVLVGVGLAHITGTDNMIASTVKKVGVAAALA